MTAAPSSLRRLAAVVPAGALVLAGLLARPALGQWSDDPAQNLLLAARPEGQAQPKLVPTADGGFYVSWFGGVADGFDVYLQRLDALGVPQWAAGGLRIADRGFSSTQDYGLALDAEGNALLAFRYADGGGQAQAVAQRVAPDGTPLWAPPGVFVSTAGANSPRIIGTTGGASVVAWTAATGGALVLQKLDAAGVPQWGPGGVTLTPPSGTFFIADLRADAAGNVIVSGSAQLSFQSRRLWAQKLAAADGAPLWGSAPVEVFDGSDGALQLGYFPPFVPDGSGGAVFAWYQVSGVSGAQARVQHVRADGSLAFPQNGVDVATTAGRVRSAPSAAYDAATGDIYVVWPEETMGLPRLFAVGAQRVDATGARRWGDGGLVLAALGAEQASQVSALPTPGGPLFAWSLGSAPSPMRIESARLDSIGAFVWPGGAVALKTAPTAHSRMQGARSAEGYAAFVWAESPDPGVVKAQNVHLDGRLGNPVVGAEEPGRPLAFALGRPFPSPLAGRATIPYVLAEAARVRAEVYDALGRRVAVLVDEVQAAGAHAATWDAGGLPGGVYYVRLSAGAHAASASLVVAR